jgi:uncharacterized membrane protein
VLNIVSAMASVGAVFAWLEYATGDETFSAPGPIFLLVTIMLSWAFIDTMFALHARTDTMPIMAERAAA